MDSYTKTQNHRETIFLLRPKNFQKTQKKPKRTLNTEIQAKRGPDFYI